MDPIKEDHLSIVCSIHSNPPVNVENVTVVLILDRNSPIELKWNQDWRLNQIAGGKKLHVVLSSSLVAPNLRLVAKSLNIRVTGFSKQREKRIPFQER